MPTNTIDSTRTDLPPLAVGDLLCAVILTYNEAAHISDCIASVQWADAVLVFDSGSTDETVQLAQAAGARVVIHPFRNYADQRDAALRACQARWVFFIDADERATPALAAEIRANLADPAMAAICGYWVPRHNFIMGRLTRGAGWYPDYQLRVMQPAHSRYDLTREVHELVILDGPDAYLKAPLIHYNYRDLRQFLLKQGKYTNFAVQEMLNAGVRPKPQNYILQPIRHFWWRFWTLRGFRDGLHGLRLSVLMAWYELQKYLRLRRAWRNHDQRGAGNEPQSRGKA